MSFKPPSNPNKLAKYLAPWYSEDCRKAHRLFSETKREHGKQAAQTKAAFAAFRCVCKRARWEFTSKLPSLLKHFPKWFWKVILQREHQVCPISAASLASHFEGLFWDQQAPEPSCPPPDPSMFESFSPEEVEWVLQHKFNSHASNGLCPVPSPLIKFLGKKGVEALTLFLNKVALADSPPKEW